MAFVLLIFAAVLEVAGDALCRAGLRGGRGGLLILGGVVLWLYGITVNAPGWNFGRLLGVYIAVFFVVSQVVAVCVFREPISPPMFIGGALIVASGLVLSCWPNATSSA
jgi:small multidrug resistance family-3 protein